jgi:hypothetical protein
VADSSQASWLILVGTGARLLFPAEVYQSSEDAELEAHRWRRGLDQLIGQTRLPPSQVAVEVIAASSGPGSWLGICWTMDEPEAPVLMDSRRDGIEWLVERAAELGCREMSLGSVRMSATVPGMAVPRVELALAKIIRASSR